MIIFLYDIFIVGFGINNAIPIEFMSRCPKTSAYEALPTEHLLIDIPPHEKLYFISKVVCYQKWLVYFTTAMRKLFGLIRLPLLSLVSSTSHHNRFPCELIFNKSGFEVKALLEFSLLG